LAVRRTKSEKDFTNLFALFVRRTAKVHLVSRGPATFWQKVQKSGDFALKSALFSVIGVARHFLTKKWTNLAQCWLRVSEIFTSLRTDILCRGFLKDAGKSTFFDWPFKNSTSVFRVNRLTTDFLVVTRRNSTYIM